VKPRWGICGRGLGS